MTVDDDLARVGIRELRDNLKDVLDKVELGATVEVTKNGRTIAMIVPRPSGDPVDRLVAEGRLLPSRSGNSTVRLPRRIQASPSGPSSGEVLDDLRAERQ
ncbi:type II toxin-antitoxin system Phd/YefM family antitoxin [Actinophytocola algeriensis]|jgi:prevent-host-death family protein|uniref:Prevent-host-death family protein n=1 Tax=Actinophytocola algeriensis TaxID=1768010 RepID=A0A7W7Q4P3_9PSEU|nr:type II toxin-antitoxin system prevent-host-death family antitoxin [Actinophytocola algeriensis]MBB4906924.1 prevent-host-death family protein [Actinophytocola algeriensis]MBE1478406.1 prevent-host-death family protein [Actinophytocola algeriensis]